VIDLGNYRNRLNIVADILEVVRRNARKTQIMYEANLSYRVLQRYLADMTDSSLICFENGSQCFTLTNKGQEFLEAYHEYSKANHHFEIKIKDIKAKRESLENLLADNPHATERTP
jgi:predicted transcriptional regulator